MGKKDDREFLVEFLKTSHAEMNWRRELEFKMVQFLLVFFTVIGTGVIALYQSQMINFAYRSVAGAVIGLVLIPTIFIHRRIRREHKAYEAVSKQIIKIWTYYDLFKKGAYLKGEQILPESLKERFGSGKGHIATIGFLWTLVGAVIVLIVLSMVFRLDPPQCP